jgi:hypothetical protein
MPALSATSVAPDIRVAWIISGAAIAAFHCISKPRISPAIIFLSKFNTCCIEDLSLQLEMQ